MDSVKSRVTSNGANKSAWKYESDSTVSEKNLPIPKDDFNKQKEFIFGELKPGMSFGETAMIDNKPRTASVWCVKNTHVLVIERTCFQNMLKAQ